jgi:hypothetical protein
LVSNKEGLSMRKNWLFYLVLVVMGVSLVISACGKSASTKDNSPAGDIPDTQAYVVYRPASGSFEVKVPEGWSQSTSGLITEFTDKLNIVSIKSVIDAVEPTVEQAKSIDAQELASIEPAFKLVETKQVTLPGGKVIIIKYQKDSTPNEITGKTYRIDVSLYEFYRNGLQVNLTLASPVGADNVDPWKIISESFKWL